MRKEENSVLKGFRFALGAVILLAIFLFFRPGVIIGPVDYEGNILVPKGAKENVIYTSVPITEIEPKIEEINQPVTNKCGNDLCDEDETISSCSSDCKSPFIKINSYDLEYELGRMPNYIESIYDQADSSTKQQFEATYLSIAENGNVFLIIDLTIDSKDSKDF